MELFEGPQFLSVMVFTIAPGQPFLKLVYTHELNNIHKLKAHTHTNTHTHTRAKTQRQTRPYGKHGVKQAVTLPNKHTC